MGHELEGLVVPWLVWISHHVQACVPRQLSQEFLCTGSDALLYLGPKFGYRFGAPRTRMKVVSKLGPGFWETLHPKP